MSIEYTLVQFEIALANPATSLPRWQSRPRTWVVSSQIAFGLSLAHRIWWGVSRISSGCGISGRSRRYPPKVIITKREAWDERVHPRHAPTHAE